ncbi:MAG: metallophosphoesterase [Verrucomicrobiales bacterium]|nr:metallophosphoesterase [Verrucomicrobiales bacterium]MCP5556659.1 metallophosphoesterase [Verrucomicrobiaceae bacterium]
MKRIYPIMLALFAVMALLAAAPEDREKGKGGKGANGQGAGAGGQVEPAVIPAYLYNVWLCRPSATSVTVSVIAWEDLEVAIDYGQIANQLDQRSRAFQVNAGQSQEIDLSELESDAETFYRLSYRRRGDTAVMQDVVRSFHTQRAPGSAFTFTLQADSHLDVSTDVRVYQQTLANMLADKPDFMIDLGDTTMVDKFGSFYTRSESQFKAQRYYMGRIAHSVPMFMVLGNHDGERGDRADMANWSQGMRQKYFPNPTDGNDKNSYYAFEWGNALFVVLDPFWASNKRDDDNWGATLGEVQYRWLANTLQSSKAAFKFVFIHHLVGGLGKDVRGGVTTAPYMEWGGKNADRSDGFAQHRPGWEMPIHQLFVKNGVSAVFHGHDHLFVKEELDGIIYQEVPQPGHPSGGTRGAEEYGYTGTILGSSGHLRVTVGPAEAKVEYVKSIVPGVTKGDFENGAVAQSYVLKK